VAVVSQHHVMAALADVALIVGAWAALYFGHFRDEHVKHLFWAPAFAGPVIVALRTFAPSLEPEAAWNAKLAEWPASYFHAIIVISTQLIYTAMGGTLLATDLLQRPKWLQSLRVQPNAKRDWVAMLPRTFRLVGFNIYLLGMLSVAHAVIAGTNALPKTALRPGLPSLRVWCFEVALMMLSFEALFYYSHRLLHSRPFYARIHKIHHEWKAPTAIAAAYAHPIEHLVSNVLPGFVGALVCRVHFVSLLYFSVQGTAATLWAHSGYEAPKGSGVHDRHHQYFDGNYGHLGLLDWFHGTEVGPGQTGYRKKGGPTRTHLDERVKAA